MNTQQLTSFLQVAEKLSFSKAAEQMYLSVPTISRNIRLLEEELGCTLFVRDRHSVKLTEAGQCFYADARIVLRAQEQALRHIQQINRTAHLRIGCTSQEEKRLISRALSELRKKWPSAVPIIVCDNYARLIAMLRQQELDIMLGSDNMAQEDPCLRFSQFGILNSLAVVPLCNPVSKKEVVSFSDLSGQVLIHLPERMIPFHSRNNIKDLLALHQQHTADIECEDEQSCMTLAGAGYGITVLPAYKIPGSVDGCVLLPIQENEPFAYGVLTAPEHTTPIADEFAEILRQLTVKLMMSEKS